jgi:hypothetical protein
LSLQLRGVRPNMGAVVLSDDERPARAGSSPGGFLPNR